MKRTKFSPSAEAKRTELLWEREMLRMEIAQKVRSLALVEEQLHGFAQAQRVRDSS